MKEKIFHSNFADAILHKINKHEPLSMPEKYWIMHLNFEHFLNHIKIFNLSADVDKLESAIKLSKKNIIAYFSDIFVQDFSNFKLNLIDMLYEKQSHINELRTLNGNVTESNFVDKLIALSEKVKSLSPYIEDIRSVFVDMNLDIPIELNKPSDMNQLKPFSQASRNFYQVYRQTNCIHSIKEKMNSAIKIIDECKTLITEILVNTDDVEFQNLRAICHENELYEIENYLVILEYALNQDFNDEAILLFLFVNLDDCQKESPLKIVIKKREQLLLNIYNRLHSFSSGTTNTLLDNNSNFIPSEITEPYVNIPPFHSQDDDDIYILLKLKKLIALFQFYCKATNTALPDPLKFHLRDLDFILKETKLTEIAYNPLLDDLPSYVLETFGLNNNDLAEILNKDKSTISRQRTNNVILKNNLWFWKTATGFTYTYINGNTTIPNYGKDSIDDTKYRLYPATAMAFAELFLKRISQLKEYQESLKNKQVPLRKKYILSEKYLSQISMKSIILSDKIREQRIVIDKLYEQFVTASTIGLDESEKAISNSRSNFQNHFERLIQKLDEAIKIMDQN